MISAQAQAPMAAPMAALISPRSSLFTFNVNPSIPNSNSKPKPISLSLPQKSQLSFKKTLIPTATTSTTTAAVESSTLKTRLHNGDTLYGLFLCSFSPTLAEIAGLSGYDFVVIDMEHGFGTIPEALTCLRALAATQTPAILRLPETSSVWAKKALDLGPQGIMFPMIDSPDTARAAVSYCRYPPNGVRGAAHSIVRASGYGIDQGYLGHCEEDLLIMCQVESEDAAENAAEIAAVDGVDCVQMGPLDLSASMGFLWDPGNKKVREKIRKVEKAVLSTGKGNDAGGAYLSGFAMPHDSPEQLVARGYHMVAGAVDIILFRSAAVEDVKKFRTCLEKRDEEDDDGGDGGDGQMAEGKDDDEKYWSE